MTRELTAANIPIAQVLILAAAQREKDGETGNVAPLSTK